MFVRVGYEALDAAGLGDLRAKDDPIVFHDLRHTFGTQCAAKGIDLPRIQRWMGHADIQTTMRYLHYVPAHDDAAHPPDLIIRQTEVRILPGPSRRALRHFPIWVSPGSFCYIRWDQDLWRRLRGRISRRSAAIALLAAVALAAVGIAGYQAGSPPSVDLGQVRTAAQAAGSEAGVTPGERKGYAEGFEEARKRSYAPQYAAAYREAYTREFELAGLEPPEAIPVRRPR